MKENILEVLMYLFENYMIEAAELQPVRADLEHELSSMGFTNGEIGKAFNWLEDLSRLCGEEQKTRDLAREVVELLEVPGQADGDLPLQPVQSIRHYSPDETRKINLEVQGILLSLEQSGMIDADIREIIIDRIMALDIDDSDNDTENAKWVIMMVLCNVDATDSDLELAEELLFYGLTTEIH